jgi:putative hemolysin
MDDISNLAFHLITLGVLFFLSAFFSISETALFSLSKAKIERLKQSTVKNERLTARLLDEPRRLLTTILIGNILVNTASATLISSLATSRLGNSGISIGIAIGIATILIVIFGEIIPKTIAIHHAEAASKVIALPTDIFSKLIYPIRKIFGSMTDSMIEFMSGDNISLDDKITAEDIKVMVDIAEEEGSIEQQEKEIINAIFDLRSITAAEIMVPRTEMVCASDDMTLQKVFEMGRESQRARIPVYKGDIDHIIGIAYIRDFPIWRRHNVNFMTVAEFVSKREKIKSNNSSLIREPFFAPETRTGMGLLQDFREHKTRMAILLDEYGGIAGLVTMKDLLRELVGEIKNKNGDTIEEFHQIDDSTFLVSGKASIRDVNKKIELELPTEGDTDTIGGYVVRLFGKIPDMGNIISDNFAEFEIAGEDGRRITEVLIRKFQDIKEDGDDEEYD